MSTNLEKTDAQLLSELMAAREATQASICRETGIHPTTLCGVLAGKHRLGRNNIHKVARFFGIEPSAFGAKRRGRTARIRQYANEVVEMGADKAPWHVRWRNAEGRQREKSCGPGPDGLRAAEELKRRIEEVHLPSFRRKAEQDRTRRIRIPTPEGLAPTSDNDGNRHYQTPSGDEWMNALATGLPRKTLHEWEYGTAHHDGEPLTTSTVVRLTKEGRRAGVEVIYRKKQIDGCKQSIADRSRGIYRGNTINGESTNEPCMTRGALRRKFGWAIPTIIRLEDNGLLTPVYFRSKGGYKPNSPRATYRTSQAEQVAKLMAEVYREKGEGGRGRIGGGFSGVWPDGPLSVEAAARICDVPVYTLHWLIKKAIVPVQEPRKPPPPYRGKPQITVLARDVRKGKTWLKKARAAARPLPEEATPREIADELSLPAEQRPELYALLYDLWKAGQLARRKFNWNGLYVLYNREQFKNLMAGKSFEEFAEKWRIRPASNHPAEKALRGWAIGDGLVERQAAAATASPEVTSSNAAVTTANGPAEQTLTAVEQAMQMFLRDPNQTVRSIARKIGCSHVLLVNDPRFKRLRESYRGKLPKGTKAKGGQIEAEEDQGTESEEE